MKTKIYDFVNKYPPLAVIRPHFPRRIFQFPFGALLETELSPLRGDSAAMRRNMASPGEKLAGRQA
jgi:hypothetical protein